MFLGCELAGRGSVSSGMRRLGPGVTGGPGDEIQGCVRVRVSVTECTEMQGKSSLTPAASHSCSS